MITPSQIRAGCLYLGALSLVLSARAAEPPSAPLSPAAAAAQSTVPAGFRVDVFAAEPDVVQPIAMCTDDRGRLWVVECLSYPTWTTNKFGKDRVVIFEDKNGDGQFDSRRVFWEKGRNLTGIELGFGGVWLCSTPELLFLPDKNRDDQPDGPPEVVLDGWDLEAQHNAFNGLTWGPDGWLYGCNGILSNSQIGRPDDGPAQRISMNCGVWRYHPVAKVFEVVAHGTTNPWGIAFNEYGQMFVANCVIKHLFHIIPGARYERMFGQDLNPHAFQLLPSCADHIHWAGGFWKTEGAERPQNDVAGGGHAHSGALIYLGDSWPDRYRNSFFTLNVHGRRMNHDTLEPSGSSYIARHQPDLLRSADPWFRGVGLHTGADGAVFISDWSDAGECHDYNDIHRDNGRIYRLSYGSSKLWHTNLAGFSDWQLIQLQVHKNDWQVAHARRLLQERAAAGRLSDNVRPALLQLLRDQTEPSRQLRVVWALHATGTLDDAAAAQLLTHQQEWVRAWTIQLLLESPGRSRVFTSKLVQLARRDPSPMVRLYLAAGLQRMPVLERPLIAQALAEHAEDSADLNIALLLWYGIEPLAAADPRTAGNLLRTASLPLIRQFLARRLALGLALEPLVTAVAPLSDPELQRDVLQGMFDGLQGRRQLPLPSKWRALATAASRNPNAQTRRQVQLLSLIFGDADAIAAVRQLAEDTTQPVEARRQALESLLQARISGIDAMLVRTLADPALRLTAIRGLASVDNPEVPSLLLGQFKSFSTEEKAAATETLAARSHYAVALLEGVQAGLVRPQEISPFLARQIEALPDPRIPALFKAALGQIRTVSQDKATTIRELKKVLTPEKVSMADPRHGRVLFNTLCASCHTLFDTGAKIAPELTGSQRANLDYLLENVVDPNAVVWDIYRVSYFETADDRVLSGIVLQENDSFVTIQTQLGTDTLPRGEIQARRQTNLSLMPEGLFENVPEQDLLDLVAYLQSPAQVALPGAEAKK